MCVCMFWKMVHCVHYVRYVPFREDVYAYTPQDRRTRMYTQTPKSATKNWVPAGAYRGVSSAARRADTMS